MKIVRYIKFDFVGFFLLWSSRMRTPRRILEWKSSLEVKSSKTCFSVNCRIAYLVDCHESPKDNADLLIEWDHIDRARQVGLVAIDDVLEELAQTCIKRIQVDSAMDDSHQPEMLIDRQILH